MEKTIHVHGGGGRRDPPDDLFYISPRKFQKSWFYYLISSAKWLIFILLFSFLAPTPGEKTVHMYGKNYAD